MNRHSPTLLSMLARLVPVLMLIAVVAASPARGGIQQKNDSKPDKATPCCHSQFVDPRQQSSEDDDAGCCGKNCDGCICPCGKLVLTSGLRLTPSSSSIASTLPGIVLSALSLSDADPIFHPPRA
jgi:hypothetical protein